ncbi:FAD-binding protein [Mycobacterium sp. E1747]|uniref:FAD-binding protein n=1 Tax=Mycobacterium sp. E1747 TaxID=1834128 RepID=UPI000800F404|nr:FAD-binding protein [Mycobacterium sp. E1747]OBH11121.1 hypothetical protein A5695_20145 [Mycobacterium sp. E1747]
MANPENTFDVIVVGGGAAGAVCAATLAARGAHTLLVAETRELGRNLRSPIVDGHRAIIQHPWWHVGWGGGAWARVMREHNLPARVHLETDAVLGVRGGARITLPTVLSAKSVSDALFAILPVEDENIRSGVERALYHALAIPYEELFALADKPFTEWLDDIGADPISKMMMVQLGAMFTSLSAESIPDHLSVFGAVASLRSFLGGESWTCVIEPDAQTGLVWPLGEAVKKYGSEVWTGTAVARIVVVDGRAVGVEMKDGRTARAAHVAMAVGNPRLPALLDPLPSELRAPLEKESPLALDEVFVLTLLKQPLVDVKTFLILVDPSTGGLVWIAPSSTVAPWFSPDDRQLVPVWIKDLPGKAALDDAAVDEYVDTVLEELYPGWTEAIDARTHLRHGHHWLNPAYLGPKVPRRSPTVDALWYVGEGTTPVGGLGLEQAAHAGYTGALEIVDSLGLSRDIDPTRVVGAFATEAAVL